MSAWVIGYDIANPRRLGKVYRRMCAHATPLEYSVFLFVGNVREKAKCLADVGQLIDDKQDDVRCYPLPQRGFQSRLGRGGFPAGIQWTGLPAGLA